MPVNEELWQRKKFILRTFTHPSNIAWTLLVHHRRTINALPIASLFTCVDECALRTLPAFMNVDERYLERPRNTVERRPCPI